ncbi:MAG: hypothetical protein EA422_05255 [Gemmatimonadales bacterium]|nr:MAG: hypothetical protein EA422_05255 [Gemmatimonadales bacterium]
MRRGCLPLVAAGILLLGGCDRSGPPSDPELRAELGLGDAASIHRITITGQADRTRLLPAYLEVVRGDVVQFEVRDRRVHQVIFPSDDLTGDVRSFLEGTGQMAPPPLTSPEVRLVLSFEGAPSGAYPFRVDGYAPSVSGRIMVRDP